MAGGVRAGLPHLVAAQHAAPDLLPFISSDPRGRDVDRVEPGWPDGFEDAPAVGTSGDDGTGRAVHGPAMLARGRQGCKRGLRRLTCLDIRPSRPLSYDR